MSKKLIRKALESKLKAWADVQSPALPVAFENAAFTPPASGAYVRAFLLPATTSSDTLDKVHRSFTGVFQVSLVLPENKGTAMASDLEASLDAAFTTTAPIEADGLKVWITNPMSAAPPLPEPGYFVIPVSCAYRADTV